MKGKGAFKSHEDSFSERGGMHFEMERWYQEDLLQTEKSQEIQKKGACNPLLAWRNKLSYQSTHKQFGKRLKTFVRWKQIQIICCTPLLHDTSRSRKKATRFWSILLMVIRLQTGSLCQSRVISLIGFVQGETYTHENFTNFALDKVKS